MKAEVVTKVIDKNNKKTNITYIDGFQDNTPFDELNSTSMRISENFEKNKLDVSSDLLIRGEQAQCIKKLIPKTKVKPISPQILSRILNRKGYDCLSAPLLARGKYFVMVESLHGCRGHSGRCQLLTVNAGSGVIIKRKFLMRKMASQPMSLFDYIA